MPYGILTSVTSTFSGVIMHVEEPCAMWCLYLLQQVHPTQPGGVVCCLPPRFLQNCQNPVFKANCVQNGLECCPTAGASSMASAVKDRQVSELVFCQQQAYCHIDGSGAND